MLQCNEGITLVRLAYDAATDREVYKSWCIEGVSWFSKVVVGAENKGFTAHLEVKVRIPASVALPVPICANDVIVRGLLKDVEQAADYEDREHFTVLSIGDNLRGSLPHWVVTGS